MTWANNESVEFFQTQVMRQNTRPPLSEWSFLHLYLTTKNDRLFNCVQWCAFALCALAAVQLAKMLGAGRRARLFALLLVATTPLAILQSTSTQNDLLSSFLAMAFVMFGWRLASADHPRERLVSALFCGLSLGLCVLTKPTLLPIVGVGGMVFAVMSLKKHGAAAIAPGALCVILALVLSVGHFYRTHEATGTLLGSEGETHHRSEPPWTPDDIHATGTARQMSPRFVASNVSRNLALLLSSPMVGLNDFVVFCVWRFHDLLGISVNEPVITFQSEKFSLDGIRHEDVIGNLPQVALFLLALCFVFLRGPWRPQLAIYSLAIIASFTALSAVLPWQPWHTRVFLPLVLLGCPLIAAALPLATMGRMFPALCSALVVYALPFVTENETRPMLGEKSIFSIPRFMQFTRGNNETYSPYHQAARNIRMRKYRSVGLLTEVDDPTYQLWPVLNAKRAGYTKLYQIDPNNISLRLPRPPKPEAVLVTFKWESPDVETSYGRYREVWREGPLSLFEQAD
jgi:4-amino-4-deoxy-L-arabinose transferase-like glycosyltransferase